MNKDSKYTPKQGHIVLFIIMSLIAIFLFMALIPDGGGAFNIPLGYAISWVGSQINSVVVAEHGLLYLIATLLITISFLGSLLAYTVKPAFIMENKTLKALFACNIVYFVSKAIAVAVAWMVFLSVGPDWLIASFTGDLMMELIAAGGSNLMSIFIVLGIAIPILTDFGLMEFLGILIRKVIRVLFTLPGRSSIDLLGSWFSSSAASVIITRDQHEKGFYTGREAAAICVNFTLVSLPFTFVIASTVNMLEFFPWFYLVITVTTLLLAVIMPRIWPLRGIKDEYLPDVGKQIDENVPANTSMFKWAVNSASKRADEASAQSVIKSGLSNWLNIFMDLIPVILAWGTIALILNEFTPVFDWLSWPFRWYLELFRVADAAAVAPATIVGFIDMFIPAIIVGGNEYIETRFIIGALSIVQIIYLAETGILILKSKIPLHIGHLAIIFLMRTIFALPVIVLLTRILPIF